VAAALAATPVAIEQARSGAMAVSQLVTPYADRSALLQNLLGLLAVVCAALAVASAILQYLKHRAEKRS
jgi:hypothetical protein